MNRDHMVSDTNGSPYKDKVMCSIYRQQQTQLNVILRHRKWSISPEEDQWSSFSEVVMTKLTHLISAMTTTIHISYSSAQQYVQMCAPFTHTHRQVTKWYTGEIKYNSFQLFGDSPNKSCFFCYGTLCNFHQNMPTGLCSNCEQVYRGRCIGLHFWSAPTGVKLPHISC